MNVVTLSSAMLMPFAPLFLLSLTIVLSLLLIALKRSHTLIATFSVIGLNASLFLLLAQWFGYFSPQTGFVSSLFIVDSFAQFNMVIILICSLACCTLAYGYLERFDDHKEELYVLMLIATLGAMLMVCSNHLAAFFISLEVMSVPMYGMLAYTYARSRSLEAGLKYLVLSATASATILMGMALIYAVTGTLGFHQIGMSVVGGLQAALSQPLVVVGAALMVFGIAFKLSAVPFHTWTPDVYQGAPAPVATFLGSVTKVAMLALGLRFLLSTATLALAPINMLLLVIASLSMIVGNLLALRQTNIKRMLSYSSIAHLGYVLAIISSVNVQSVGYASLYMAVYALTTIGSFGVITLMSSPYRKTGEAEHIDHYRGIFWKRPVLTAVLTVMLLSLAGVPLTAGFISKFFAIFATVSAQNWWLSAMIILGSAISLYYYLHFLVILFKRPQQIQPYDAVNHWGLEVGGMMVMVVTVMILYYGIFPDGLSKILMMVNMY